MHEMKLNAQLLLGLLVPCCLLSVNVQARERADQPNIVFILADDLGCGDLGVTGHPYARSPNLDQLAREGIRFEQAYMAGAWCAPSRYGLMSGVFPARHFSQTRLLPVDRPCVTSVLHDAGYATAHFGKWHMGDKKQKAPPPEAYGIDESFTTQSSGAGWSAEARKDPHYREKTTPHYVNLTIDFIRRHKNRPFYVNLWIYPTHSYINPTPEQLAVYQDLIVDVNDFENPLQRDFLNFVAQHGDVQAAMRAYCADVTAMDAEVGRLLDVLAALKLRENTIVVFSSDNGPGPLCNNWDNIVKRYGEKPLLLNSVGSARQFRDRKISLHEGGIRAPLIVRWPRRIRAGTVDTETLWCGVDYLPTVAALAGAALPAADLDGEDLSAAFLGSAQLRTQTLFWSDRPQWSALRDNQWKAHLRGDQFSLYDLSRDPSESNNVAGRYPRQARQYHNELRQWIESVHEPLP